MAVQPGTRIGPYEIKSLLGAGGMGEVFLAHDARLGRDVALKVLPSQFAADPDRLRRFENEARAASQLNHPNILTVFDIGTEDGRPYVVAERLEGETLRDRLQRGPMGEREALEIGRQVARGLSAAHSRGIVHRDLKPENLFLTRDGHVKLLDFGVAKLTGDASRADSKTETQFGTESGVILGTVQYMAPEQVKGQAIDQRADLFAFGAVLFEMLTGKAPFTRPSRAESMSAVMNDTPPSLDEERPGSSPLVARVVEHCLEKAPEQRFQSARDLLFALDSASSRSSSGPAAASSVGPAPASTRSRGIRGIGIGAGAVALALAIGWWAGAMRAPRDDRLTFARVTRFAASDAIEFAPALSPDGKWIAYLADTPMRTDLWVKFRTGGEAVNLTAGLQDVHVARRNDVGGLDISPDGSQILFPAGPPNAAPTQQSMYVIGAPLGGAPRKLISFGLGARWSPDGKKLVYVVPGGSAGDSLQVSDADGGDARTIVPLVGGVHTHFPAWSADGEYIYFTRATSTQNLEPSEIYRVRAAGGTAEAVVTTNRRAGYPFPALDGSGLLYSANPIGEEPALWWLPTDGRAVRLTTGVGEYLEARLSRDKRTLVSSVSEVRRELASIPVGENPHFTDLTEGSSGDADPAVSPRGDRLAFSSTRQGDRHIWTSRLDGTDARELTLGDAVEERPAWSPDASTIAFVSTRGTSRAIWVVGADGSGLRKILDVPVIDSVTWSPDAAELAFAMSAGAVPGIFRVHLNGGQPVRVATPEGATSPNWSAARNLIAYISNLPPANGNPSRAALGLVTPDGHSVPAPWGEGPRLSNGTVTWSHDGQSIVGLSQAGAIETSIYVFEMDRATAPRLLVTLAGNQRCRGIAWFPDKSKVIAGLSSRASDIVLFDQGP
jgi:Tol biopolymer transport system component